MVITFYANKLWWDSADFNSLPVNLPDGYAGQERNTGIAYFFNVSEGEWLPLGTTQIDTTDLKAYYQFNELSGDLINRAGATGSNESLGVPADGQSSGGFTQGSPSLNASFGTSYLYDGVNGRTQLGTSTSQFNFFHSSTSIFSINLWYKANNPPLTIGDLISTYGVSGFRSGMSFGFATSQRINCTTQDSTNGTLIGGISTGTDVPNDSDWHMVTVTSNFNLANNNMHIYIDGVEVGGSPFNKTVAASLNTNAQNAGSLASSGSAQNFLDANMDEVSVWNRILTDSERALLFNNGAGLPLV